MLDAAARRLDGGGNDVAAVGDGGRADDENHIAALPAQGADGGGHLGFVVGAADLGFDVALQPLDALAHDLGRLVKNLFPGRRQSCLHETDRVTGEGGDPHQAAGLLRRLGTTLDDAAVHREGDDLDGRHELLGVHRLEGGHRGDGDGFVDPVDRVEGGAVDHRDAAHIGVEIGAPGEGGGLGDVVAGGGGGDALGGRVLADVAFLEARRDDFGDAGRLQGRDVVGAQQAALLEGLGAGRLGVRQDGAGSAGGGNLSELHAASSRQRSMDLSERAMAPPRTPVNARRLSRLWIGRNSSTWGMMARAPIDLGSKSS